MNTNSKNSSNPLTRDLIVNKCKNDNLKEIKNINLWGCDLDDMSMLRQLPNLEVASLSVNKIAQMSDFALCLKLQELFLRKN